MAEVLQNLRYNNMKVFMPGTIFYGNTLIYNTNEPFGPAPTNYTEVKYIYLTTPDNINNVWIDTGIVSTNDMEMRLNTKITTANGWLYVGHTGADNPHEIQDDNDYRWFDYQSKFCIDVASSRFIGTSQILNTDIDISMKVNGTSVQVINNSNSSTIVSRSYSGSFNAKHVFILLDGQKFRSLVIKKISDGTILFNGVAAIDENNTPCVYDSISDELLYPYRYSQTSGTVVLYEAY